MRFPLISRIFLFIAMFLFAVATFLRMLFAVWDFTSLFYLFSFFVCLFLSLILDIKGYYNLLTLKSTKRGLSYAGSMLLLLIALFAINFGLSYVPKKIDVSESSAFTLTPLSKSVAKSFTDKVEFIYLQIPKAGSKETDDRVKGSIQLYEDENPKIVFRKANLLLHPEMVKEFDLKDQEEALFVKYKERKERFYKTDENNITQALLRLLKGRKTIYFSVGLGEPTIDNERPRGLVNLKTEVERLFYDVQPIHLESENLPKDAAALILIGPEKDIPIRVQEKIFDYFMAGGRVFMAFDPLNEMNANAFIQRFGVQIEKGIVHQEQSLLANLGSHVVTGLVKDPKHPVVADLQSQSPIMFYVTGALSILPGHEGKVTPLIISPKTAVLRAGYTKQDKFLKNGPFNLIVEVKNDKGGEVFIADDSDIFANQFLYQHANPSLMFNLFSYLSKDEDIVGKSDHKSSSNQFLVTDIQFKMYIGLFIIPLPILLFSAGAFLWFRRRWL
ncbi:MAG: Gldg family protein [Bdellovibrionaceae bacterium]|nr:Gldg family protein [Pseudobdellovibrionaceae bacterium]